MWVFIHCIVSRNIPEKMVMFHHCINWAPNAWTTLKQKTKKKVKDIAKDLIALAQKRKATRGFAFSPDTYLQNELEASFIYEDTLIRWNLPVMWSVTWKKSIRWIALFVVTLDLVNGSRDSCRVQSCYRWKTGGGVGSDHHSGFTTLQHIQRPPERFSLHCRLYQQI